MARQRRFKPVQLKKAGPTVTFKAKPVILIWVIILATFFFVYLVLSLFDTNIVKEGKLASMNNNNAAVETVSEDATGGTRISKSGIVNPVPENRDRQGSSYFTNCVFVGDVILGGISDEVSTSSDNILCDGTYSLSSTYEWKDKSFEKKNIYIMLGFAQLGEQSTDRMIKNYGTIIDNVTKNNSKAKVYIMALPPVSADSTKTVNSEIDKYNSLLLQLADEKNVYYVDTNTLLKDNTGNLSEQYVSGDTLSTNGWQAVADYLAAHTAG